MKKNNIFHTLPPRVSKNKERIFEIDYLRGFSVILMVLYHFCFDLHALFRDFFTFPDCATVPEFIYKLNELGTAIWTGQEYSDLFIFLQHFFSGLFMFICGISCCFSKNNFKRGIQLTYVSVIMTILLDAVSVIAQTQLGIDFNIHIYLGILHSLAIGILIYALVSHFSDSYYVTFIASIALFIMTITITNFDMPTIYSLTGGPQDYFTYKQPSIVIPNFHLLLLGRAWDGDDYFFPLHTATLVMMGATFGKIVYAKRKQLWPKKLISPIGKGIAFLGRHTLESYVVHQVAAFLILYLIVAPFGAELGGNGNLRCSS